MTKKRLLVGASFSFLAIVIGMLLYLSIIYAGNYVIDDKKLVMHSATSIVNEDGDLVTKLFVENREIISLYEVPLHVQQAFISIEDARFLEHQGIDFRAITRALYRDILAGSKVEGGSTITQQLVKNTFLSHDKTWLRKTKEVLIAMNIERKYSKDEILEMYLNRIYFGHGAYGIQAASKLYFNKDVSELTLEEGALLAGLPKAPTNYSPIVNVERSKQRRDLVLSVMHRRGYLSAEEAVRSQGKMVVIEENRSITENAYLTYVDMILEEAENKYALTNEEVLTGGYTIVVPMDKELQRISYELFQQEHYFPGTDNDVEAAFVLVDSSSGGIIAVQGGRNYVSKGLNRVKVKRQPGSTFKPLAVYAPAIEEDVSQPYSMLKDELIDYAGYSPRNATNQYSGELSMFDALAHSANAPAVWLLNEFGIERSKSYLEQLEMPIDDHGLAIALGGLSDGITPLQLTKAYRAFAKNGKIVEPYVIQEIYDRNGTLIAATEPSEKPVFSPQTAWYMTRMLEAAVKEGTAKDGYTSQALAGKTGTTSFTDISGAARDAWFVGYTPHVVGTLWMGYDITTTEHHLKGGSRYPTVLFKELINELPTEKSSVAFTPSIDIDELEAPIRVAPIYDLTGAITFKAKGLLGVELEWSTLPDDRVDYHVYEVADGISTKIGSVKGEGQYVVNHVNPFALKEYFVVPYNSFTQREGPASNVVSVSTWWNPFSRNGEVERVTISEN